MSYWNLKQRMSDSLASTYRFARTKSLRLLDPLDLIWLKLNRLGHYPPISRRRHVNHLGTLDGYALEFVGVLRGLKVLTNEQKILDFGCGCGLLEIALSDTRWTGAAVGIDIHYPSIEWATAHVADRGDFSFHHADIWNAAYWPQGNLSPDEYFDKTQLSGSFDLAIAKSVLTHAMPTEATAYVRHIPRLLAPGGTFVFTAFCVDDKLNFEGLGLVSREIDGVHVGLAKPHAPAAFVAYERRFIESVLKETGATAVDYLPGLWARTDGVYGQDIFVVQY